MAAFDLDSQTLINYYTLDTLYSLRLVNKRFNEIWKLAIGKLYYSNGNIGYCICLGHSDDLIVRIIDIPACRYVSYLFGLNTDISYGIYNHDHIVEEAIYDSIINVTKNIIDAFDDGWTPLYDLCIEYRNQ